MSESLPSDWLDQIRRAYPKRVGGQGWGHLRKRVPALIQQGESFESLLDGVRRYAALMKATGQEKTPYVKQACTFFGPGEWWLEDYDLPDDGSVQLTVDQEAEKYGLQRQEGESDESLRRRVGVAQTKAMYG